MIFVKEYDIKLLNPADYNPRKINEKSFEKLQYSIKKFGFVKPVILNGDKRILTAGHQRTKASKAIGLETVPAIIIERSINIVDEVRFNLLHNSIETNLSKVRIKNANTIPFGYSTVKTEDIEVLEYNNAGVLKDISGLVAKYGEWGSVVIDEDGNVVQNAEYGVACSNLKKNLLVYKMKNETVNEFCDICNNNEFGEYYFEALGVKAYNQLYCQMHRLGSKKGEVKKDNKSALYENFVLPAITKNDRIVDFGAGRCDYINALKEMGYMAHCYEPHFKAKATVDISIKDVVGMIRDLQQDIKSNNLYDVVVLDSVINSVTSLEFEDMVLTTCNALCNEEGKFYTATRNIAGKLRENKKIAIGQKRDAEYLDKNGFSATFRDGVWSMQRFHTPQSFEELLLKYFHKVDKKKYDENVMQFVCSKPRNLSLQHYKKCLDVEFNMEYPNNYRHNKHGLLVDELLKRLKERGCK